MNKITYDKPARLWREALPIGNGHTGVMVYGGKHTETLCFNDSTLWSGYPKDYNSSQSLDNLDKVRQLVFDGKNSEAQKLAEEKLAGFYSETFLPLACAKLCIKSSASTAYKRTLDLENGIHTTLSDGLKRDAFASFPDDVVCYHIEGDKAFSVKLSLSSKLKSKVTSDSCLNITGNAPDYAAPNYVMKELFPIKYNEKKGMAFCLSVKAISDGAVILSSSKLVAKNATYVDFYFAAETGFEGYDRMPCTNRASVLEKCQKKLKLNKTYEQIKTDHVKDFNGLFNKSAVSFKSESDLTTDRLLLTAKDGDVVPSLAELFYNYGKYMIVSGSRKSGQLLNLQGQWNNSKRPPWSSNYTVNINTQMNYWGVSRANLLPCLEPYLNMVYEVVQNGKKTAKINYGCDGFACNHNVDIWRKTPPVIGACNYMYEPLCGVWLANEIFAHFSNGAFADEKEKIEEITREGAQFALDYLVEHNGEFVICPSASAENAFISNGQKCTVDYSTAFDIALVKQIFTNYISLGNNDDLQIKIEQAMPKMRDFSFGENGICEYHKDYEMPERGHRHFSPLYAFYPAKVIKYYEDNERARECEKLFYDRISHSKWYKNTVKSINKQVKGDENKAANTLAFFHIPMQEYCTAYDLKGDESTLIRGGKLEAVCPPVVDDNMFETMVELGSTKGVFVGHDHMNNFEVEYKGIRLCYGLSDDHNIYVVPFRGGKLINIKNDGSFTTQTLIRHRGQNTVTVGKEK